MQGPDSDEPAVFGGITSWTITAEAATDSSRQFVEHMFGDGYVPWIAVAPEGKVPVRLGPAEDESTSSEQWAELPVGVDTKWCGCSCSRSQPAGSTSAGW